MQSPSIDKFNDSIFIGAPVISFIDTAINAFRIMRTPIFAGSVMSIPSYMATLNRQELASTSKEKDRKAPRRRGALKVPRPPNAFILYRQYHHPKIRNANPDIHNNEICGFEDISPHMLHTANWNSKNAWKAMELRDPRSQSLLQNTCGLYQEKTRGRISRVSLCTA